MKKRIELPLDIDEEVKIAGHQAVVFWKGTKLGDLYSAIIEHWKLNVGPFEASIFYNLGHIHGIREERARRKKDRCCSR